MNVPENLLMPNGRPWSSSSVDLYDRCPLAWRLRYGQRPDGGRDVPDDGVGRRRGRVLHEALGAALQHADIELRRERRPIDGTLRRYYGPARTALGRAWVEQEMPSDSALAATVMDMFERALDAVPIPAPGALYGVEQSYTHITRGGYPVVFVPDVARWVDRGRGVLRVTDWKSGKVDEAEVRRHQQLLRYAGWIMQRDPRVTACEIELFALREGRGYPVPAEPEMIERAVERFDRIVGEALAGGGAAKVGPQCTSCRYARNCPALAAHRAAAESEPGDGAAA